MKTYNIIAGINGAGKTSLYEILNRDYELGVRVNIDELVTQLGGTWNDTLSQIRAGRAALNLISECIDNGVTFHQETTLPGVPIFKSVNRAKEKGYCVRLFFVGIDDVKVAINRVRKRIAKGGHGVEDHIIQMRFEKLPENLKILLPLCDTVIMYDNTVKFRQIAMIENGKCIDCDSATPKWMKEFIKTKGDG